MSAYLGHLAALGTSLAWSFSSTSFTLAGRQTGSVVVNRTRLLLAVLFVALTHRLLEGQFLPLGAEPFRWGWLALSGIIGYVVGDGFLFQAFVMIGPRLSMLLMALAPVFSTVLAWVLLGEALARLRRGGGAALPELPPRQYAGGILFGLGAALGQAGGLLASRLGLAGDFPALSGNLIRLLTATLAIWGITVLRGQTREHFLLLRAHPRAWWGILGGAVAGPFVGVWLSLVSVQHAPLGIASTLMSLSPIFLLPVGRYLFGEQIGMRAVAGTGVAVLGTALLFL